MIRAILTVIAVTACLALSAPLRATTWASAVVPDPIKQGAECEVSRPVSSGSYIYHWPSKYDQVFWPLTDESGIWFCAESGFTAFLEDFDLREAERANIASYLAANYQPSPAPVTLPEKLRFLEDIYSLRDKDGEFRIRLLRALAYMYDGLNQEAAAAELRAKALEAIRAALATNLEEGQRLEYLFVASAYAHELGDEDRALETSKALDAALAASKSEEIADFVDYLRELRNDLAKSKPGGILAPE